MQHRFAAPLVIICAGVLWGIIGLFIRMINQAGIYAMECSEARVICTAIILLVVVSIYNRKLLIIKFKDLWCFLGTGVISVLSFNLCYFKTIEDASLSVAAVLLYTAPIFVMLLSRPLFGEHFTVRKVIAVAMAFGGCVLVSGILSDSAPLSPSEFAVGIGAGLSYGLYSIFSRYAINRGYTPFTIITYTFVFAAVGGIFLADFGSLAAAVKEVPSVIVPIVLCAVFSTVLPYILYTFGLMHIESSRAMIMVSTEPIAATITGFIAFGEAPTIPALVGMVLVVGAIVILNLKSSKRTPTQAPS